MFQIKHIATKQKKTKNCLKRHNGCISKYSTNANVLDYFNASPNINYSSKTDILALMVNSSPRGLKKRGDNANWQRVGLLQIFVWN